MKDEAAGSKRRGNRSNRGAKNREKRSTNVSTGEDTREIPEDMKRQRVNEHPVAGAHQHPQVPFLDLPLAPRGEIPASAFNFPIHGPHRHSSSNSEADQMLEWLTNNNAAGGAGADNTGIGGLDDVSGLRFPFHGDTNFPAFPSFPTSGQGGLSLSLGGGREIFCTPEPPMLASPLISPSKTSSGLAYPYPSAMPGFGTMKNAEHHPLHNFSNLPGIQNPLRPSSFGGERSKSAASSRSAAAIQGNPTTTMMNVPMTHIGINKSTPSSQNRDSVAGVNEGAGFFSPPLAPRKKLPVEKEQQTAVEDGRQRSSRQRVMTRQIASHAFFSPDSETSPAS